MKRVLWAFLLATILWALLFSPWTASYIPFWQGMLGATALLTLFAFNHKNQWRERLHFRPSDLLWGIASAGILWGIFWLGNYFSNLLFDFAEEGVDSIYAIKSGENTVFLSLALMLWIGPAEEIFWRGYIQEKMTVRWGPHAGLAVASIAYASVHIISLNFMLIMAAWVCGIFWGWMYRKTGSLWAVILSHALWDCAVFLWFTIL